jgi:uncharacterized membrane protein
MTNASLYQPVRRPARWALIVVVRRNGFVLAVVAVMICAVSFSLLFVGLAIVIPVLAHASWHVYRRVVEV